MIEDGGEFITRHDSSGHSHQDIQDVKFERRHLDKYVPAHLTGLRPQFNAADLDGRFLAMGRSTVRRKTARTLASNSCGRKGFAM